MLVGPLVNVASASTAASRLVWPIAAVLVVALSVVVASVFWTSEEANGIEAEKQRARLIAAVAAELDSDVRGLSSLTARHGPALVKGVDEPLSADMIETALDQLKFDALFLIDHNGRIRNVSRKPPLDAGAFAALARPAVRELAQRIEAPGVPDPPDASAPGRVAGSRLVRHGGLTIAVTALPLAWSSVESPIMVGLKVWDDAILDRLAKGIALTGLHIEDTRSHALAIPLSDANGNDAASLSWTPDRPGDVIRTRLIPLTLIVVMLLLVASVLAFAHVLHAARAFAQSEERAHELAGHDALSGLPNRLIFTDRLQRELIRMGRSTEGLAVMLLDLDRFKEVNDSYGHEAGDELIKQVAQRLSDLLRGADTLARFGGDEFAIIQTGVRDARNAEALARRILEALTHPFNVPGGAVTVGVSIGVSLAPNNSEDRETLMRLADTALYQAKNEGRNRYSFFQRQMNEALKLRKIVEDDLRTAISNDEMKLHYQPVVSADGETMVGVEALVRWPHTQQGLIAPGQFISIAEERGLIIPLGEWVLRRACEDAKRWPQLKVAVNVSPIQFRHRDFVTLVTRVIERSGLDPTRLEIELTEGVVLDDADAAEIAMMELRALGVRLALDDFGTGYSSLIYLRRFAFDKIKIDRSFLESMEPTGESAILVHSVVHLGRALGLTVTAEGVETREQHRFLQAVGCHELQGYLFSRPVPAEEIDRMIEVERHRAPARASAA